jgi:LacI family transcriptional regulator
VSSALAGRGEERRISEETVKRIREAAAELGYVPNMAGRRLRAHKAATRQFDLAIYTSFEAPLPLVGQALHALQRAVDVQTTENTRYAVTIEMFHAGKLRDKPGLLDASRYHGMIITNTLPEDDQFLAKARLPYPIVILGRRIASYYCVLEAPNAVGRRSAEVLLDAGCRQLAILHGKRLTYTTSDRLTAFQKTVRERTGQAPIVLVSDGLEPRYAAIRLEAFFAEGGQFDGLFCVNDSLGIGAYKAIKRAGLSVPRDVAVVGMGDYELAEFFDPPLTSVAGANDAMVDEAVPLLFRILRGETDAPREILVVPPVILRESTFRVSK